MLQNTRHRFGNWLSTLVLLLPMSLLIVAAAYLYGSSQLTRSMAHIESRESLGVALGRAALEEDIDGIKRDLAILAKLGSLHDALESPSPEAFDRLADDLLNFASGQGIYDQIRWLDETGTEVVRVNHRADRTERVADDQLQFKGNRYYFTDVFRLAPGQIYISPFDLNIEGGRVEVPHRPMIRIGTPVSDASGRKRGIVLLNYDGKSLLEKFARQTNAIHDHVAVLNGEGFWLYSTHADRNWGFMFGRDDLTLARAAPDAWQTMLQRDSGVFNGPDGYWTWDTVFPLGSGDLSSDGSAKAAGESAKNLGRAEYFWKVVGHVDGRTLGRLRSDIWPPVIATAVALLVLATFGASRITVAEGQVRAINANLEHLVHQRTNELDASVAELRQTIDQREAAQKRLRDRENRLRAIFDVANDAILVAERDSRRLIDANPAATEQFGYSLEELLALRIDDIHPQAELPAIRDMFERQASGDIDIYHNVPVLRKDGSLFFADISTSPLELDGRPCVTGFFRDTRERRQAEETLRLTSSVFENTAEGVVITDADNRILQVNRAFREITGYTPEEVEGRDPGMLKSGRHDDDFYRELWHQLNDTGHWRGEIWNRRKDGSVYPEWTTISRVNDENGTLSNYVAVFSDISHLKETQQKLNFLARHDPLTELPNRAMLGERLEHAIKQAHRNRETIGLMFIDLDHFKHINDSLGHPVGDEVLKFFAREFVEALREDDTVSRIGGDEFVVVLEDIGSPHNASLVAEKLMELFGAPVQVAGSDIHVTASLGIALFPRDGGDAETLMSHADAAMYRAKSQGRNTFEFYTEELTLKAAEHLRLENGLRKAIECDDLQLVYQPQVRIDDGAVVGLEALTRWQHPESGPISPAKFIPLAEETGLIQSLGRWVLTKACEQAKAWIDSGIAFGRIAVNVSPVQLDRGNLRGEVEEALQRTGLPPDRLEIEITEGFIMHEPQRAIRVLNAIRTLGVSIAIDDFGTGYSSLSYLKGLPVDRLKIDRSFVRDIPDDSDDVAITATIIGLGRNLGLGVIAEGVESPAQADFLYRQGCHEIQGFLYFRPMSASELTEALSTRVRMAGQ